MTFETSSVEPGSYVVAIDAPGVDYEDVYPVVVSAYDLETAIPVRPTPMRRSTSTSR